MRRFWYCKGMRKAIIALALAAATSATAFAHPHVFIDVSVSFDFDGDRCLGFWQEWTFDPVFSAQIKNDFMLPASGPLSRSLQDELYNGAFINLRRYGFYTLLRRGDKRESPKAVTQFGAELRANRVVYRFYVPLDASYLGGFSVAVFDTTYYSAVRYLGEPGFTQRREGAATPRFAVESDRRFPVYYNPQGGPQDMTTYARPAPGLLTIYPDEIVIRF